ncbi:hypothetical protein KEJ37_00320 [Candidatus Bathyarchaeota archaeon]|nr:hypothetical protein [Candidatus Bathyarchaeota archaeon]
MPKPGYLAGHRQHKHSVTVTVDLPSHTHGGVTAGTDSTAAYDFAPVTVTVTTTSEKG